MCEGGETGGKQEGEGEGPVVKANRPPDKTHRGSLLTPIQETGSKSEGRDREREGSLTHRKHNLRGEPRGETAALLQDSVRRKEKESQNEIQASILRR